MKKYSEEKEEEQWDDDFIFDAAPVPKKKSASAPLSITSHLSTASTVTLKEKKKTATSTSTWSNAFKKMGPDPRQNKVSSSSRTSHTSSSHSTTTSTNARTVTSTASHNIAPIGANEEFAFFDSEDTVGFKRAGPSVVKTTPQPAVKPVASSSSSKNGTIKATQSFDEGLDQNLGFDDEDFIPNVGFDDADEAGTPKGKKKAISKEALPVNISLSSQSGQSGFSSSGLSEGPDGAFDESGYALSDTHSQRSSFTSASKSREPRFQPHAVQGNLSSASSSSSATTAASTLSLMQPPATALERSASNGNVASVVAMINAKRPSPVRPVPFFGGSPLNNLSNSAITTPTSAQSGSSSSNKTTNTTGANSHSPTHSVRSAASTVNVHTRAGMVRGAGSAMQQQQQQQPSADDLEQQLEDLIESDQPLAFDVLDSLHSNSSMSASFTFPSQHQQQQQQQQRDAHSRRLSGSSYDPLNPIGHNSTTNSIQSNHRYTARHSPPSSQAVAGVSNAAYNYSNTEVPIRHNSRPLSVASSSSGARENYPSTGSKQNSFTRSSGSIISNGDNLSTNSSPRALTSSSRQHRSDKSRLSSTNSCSSIPLSVSDSESLDDWGAQFGYNGRGRSSFSTTSSITAASPRGGGGGGGSKKMTLPPRVNVDFEDVDFGSDGNASDPDSPFGGALQTPSERGSLQSRHSNKRKSRKFSNDYNDSHRQNGASDFMSEAGESWLGGGKDLDAIGADAELEEQEEGFLIRHKPHESLDGEGQLLGLSGEFNGSDSQGSEFHSDFDSRSGSSYTGSSHTGSDSCTHSSDEEEGDWDLDLEISRAGEAQHPGNNAQTYKEILTGKAAQGGAAHSDETPSEADRESLLDYLKSTVHKTIFPPSLSPLTSPVGLEHGNSNNNTNNHPENQYNPDLGGSCDSADSSPGGNRNIESQNQKQDHPPHQKGAIPKSNSTPSLSSRSHNNEAYEEEGHNVETANPHLRGLLNWVDASATSLHAVLSNANSNRDFNARTLLQSEVQLPRDDPLYVEHLLERCEVHPCSDACIRTLETVSKWLRGVCNLHENAMGALHSNSNNNNNALQDSFSECEPRLSSNSSANLTAKMRRTASLGETRASQFSNHGHSMKASASNAATPSSAPTSVSAARPIKDKKFGELSGNRLDRIYDSCDDILQEQLVATTSALGAGYRKLLEISTRRVANQARADAAQSKSNSNNDKAALERANSGNKNNHWLSMGMVAVRDPVTFGSPPPQGLQHQSSISSISRVNSTTAADDDQLVTETFRLSANLISLYRLQVNMLEMRIHLYDSFELIACMELLQKISEELDKVTSTLFPALQRVLPAVEKSVPEQVLQRQQLDALTVVANDLLGCCFSIKLLAISAVSPITFQPLPEGCQRIVSSASDLAKMNSFDGLSGSEDSRGGATVKSDGSGIVPHRIPYNVIYELTLGTHFLDLMLLIPSPSVVRSKLCIAAYTYLQKLKKKQLPWQSQEFKLVSIRQHLESFANMFNIYNGADAFGLNYSEMENNSFTLSLTEVESSIVQSFSEVFGTLDQPRIMHLLLFEGSCELLPTVQRDLAGAAAFLHKPVPRQTPAHATVVGAGLIPDTVDSDISDPSHSSPRGPYGTFTSIRSVFRHVSAALNFDKTLQVSRKRWVPSLAAINTLNDDSSSAKDPADPAGIDADAAVSRTMEVPPIELTDSAMGKAKIKALSYSMRYELFHFCNQVLFRLAQAIVEMSPNVALDVYQMCILLLAHLRHTHDRARVEKVAAMLAVKVGRRDAAIWHGEAVLKDLQRTGDNINEMLYMTDLLAAQYSENAQYELAAKALFSAISVLNRRHKHAHAKRQAAPPEKPKKFKLTRHSSKESSLLFGARIGTDNNAEADANSAMDFERALDPLLLKLGRLLLQFGCPDRAADTFQVLLSSLCERTDCLANDAKKITVLSWLAEAYLELEDFSSCAQVLGAIKSVRDVKLRKATAWAASGGNLEALADSSEKSKSPQPSPRQRPRAPSRAASGVGALMRMSFGFISRGNNREVSQSPPVLETTRDAPVVLTESFDAVLMSTSYDISDALRPPSRGIANAESADSFDLDGPPQPKPFTNLPHRPLPPTPSSVGGMHRASPAPVAAVTDAAGLRARPLPPTPKTAGGGQKNAQLESHATLQRRPLPPTPLASRTISRENSGSNSEASSTGTSRRKKPDLRIDVNVRPTSSSSITDDIIREQDSSSNVASSGCSSPSKPRRTTTPKAGGSNSVPVPLSTRSNSMHGTPSGAKRRKNRALKNLAPLQMPASPTTTQLQFGMSGSGSTTDSPVVFNAGTLTPLSIPAIGSNSNQGSSPRAGPVGMSPVSGGGVAVSSMCLHYLRNSPEANLPQFCVTTEDLDLGLLKARLHFKNKHYALALKCLLPTMMGVELTVIGTDRAVTPISGNVKHNWSRQSLMELGELYYLRGKIQLEAAQSSAEVAFPLQVGSTHLFQKVQEVLWVEEKHGRLSSSARLSLPNKTRTAREGPLHPQQHHQSAQPRRFARAGPKKSGKASKAGKPPGTVPAHGRMERQPNQSSNSGQSLFFACRHPSRYTCSADLCWDAMLWFNRAREVARLANDEVGGALAANAFAMCHLLPTFVPTALFGVPFEKSRDLSVPATVAKESAVGTAGKKDKDTLGRTNRMSTSRGTHRPARCASMVEVQASMEAALDVNANSCLPLPLITSYLNLAEMCVLVGDKENAFAFWNETKELFMLLFADGALVPLVRRASMRFIRKLALIVNRMVRFLWTLDRATVNSHLYLLDLQIILSHEVERAQRKCVMKAAVVSDWLTDVLDRLLPVQPSQLLSQKVEQDSARSRSSKSSLSRFFSRIFSGSKKSAKGGVTSEGDPFCSQRSDEGEHGGRGIRRVSLPEDTEHSAREGGAASKKPKLSSMRSLLRSGARSNATFDSFINRFGFEANMDVRRFYNLMNADLVLEKVHDFGWSNCVEHDQLLKPISAAAGCDPGGRPFSVDSVQSSASSQFTAQVHYTTSTGQGLAGPGIATNIDVLVVLNLRAKSEYQEKYRSLAAARFVKDHVLRRGDLMMPPEADEDDQEGRLSDLNISAEMISCSRDEGSVVESGVMNLQSASGEHNHNHSHKQLLIKSLSPRSGSSSKFGSFSAKQPLNSPLGAFSSCHSNVSSAATKFVDPLLDIPVDPFADFDWMDESFADYSPHSLTLQARALLERQQNASHSRSRNKYKRLVLGDDVAQFPALFMPEFDEAHLFSVEQVRTSSSKFDAGRNNKHLSIGSIATTNPFSRPAPSSTAVELVDSAANREYLRSLDERAETILIQRAWRCYLLLQNAQWGYRSGKRSLSVLHNDVRSALGCLTLNMVRLRAFSRQYQPTIQDFDRLVPELAALPASVGHLGVSKPLEDSTQKLEAELARSRGAPLAPKHVQALKLLIKENKLRQPVLLQHRLPYFVFVLHLEDNLLLYRPHDGSKHVQKLGGAGFIAYNKESSSSEDVSRANQALMMNSSIASMGSFLSDKSGGQGPGTPAAQSPQKPLRTPSSAPMGIAQVEKKAPPKGRTLEQKLSIMSMLSVLSGDSEGAEEKAAVPPKRAPLGSPSPASQTTRRFFAASLDENQDYYALSSSDNTGSHDSSWGRLSASNSSYIVPERVPPRKTLARGELEGSSLGSVSTFLDAAVNAGKPVFKTREAELLYNLAASGADQSGCGGRDQRRAIFAEMKAATGVLHSSLQFFLAVSDSIKQHHQLQLVTPKPLTTADEVGKSGAGAGERQEAMSCKSGFISESSDSSLNTLSILSLNSISHSALPSATHDSASHVLKTSQDHHPAAPSTESHPPHLVSALSSSSFVALSASMSNMLGLFASSDGSSDHTVRRQQNKGEGTSGWDGEEEEDGPGQPPQRSLPLTVVCSHSAAALPWEVLLLQAHNAVAGQQGPQTLNSAPVVRSLTLLALCAQAYSATCCTIQQQQQQHFAATNDEKAQPTELALARAVVGPQWQQKATFVAVAYESRELPHGALQELRANEEERRRRAARHSLIALLQPHPQLLGDTERMASRREYFPTLQAGAHSPSHRTKQAHFRTVLSTFDQGTLPSASPLFSNDKSSTSFFGKSEMIVAGQDFLSTGCLALHSETAPSLPHPRAFWRKLPAAPPLRRTLSSAQLAPGCRVEAVPHSSFPLLVLSYVDYLQLSDALSYLVSHRPDAVLVFAPLFVIEPLVIELKLSLDRWCKPDAHPISSTPPTEKVTNTMATAGSSSFTGGGAFGNSSGALNAAGGNNNRAATSGSSGRFLFSSFLNRGFSTSAGTAEASTSTLNFNESFLANGGASSGKDLDMGMSTLPPSNMSLSSSANASSATTLAGHSAKRGSLPKIVEESPRDMSMSRSGSSSFSPGNNQHQQQRYLVPTRSHSNDAIDALLELNTDASLSMPATPTTITASPNRPSDTNNSSFSHSSSISRGHSLRDGHHHNQQPTTKLQHNHSTGSIGMNSGAAGQQQAPRAHTYTAARSQVSSSNTSSSFSGGSRRSGKSLKAKERTWVYHAVMAVVQDMQREHEVPIVVFI